MSRRVNDGKLFAKVHPGGQLWKDPNLHPLKHVTGPPARWTQLFLSLHRDRELSDGTRRRELLIGVRTIGQDVWNELWKQGFVPTVLDAAADVYFCGYSKEELLAADDTRRRQILVRGCAVHFALGSDHTSQVYVRWLLMMLYACLHQIMSENFEADHPHPLETQTALDIVETKISALWTALWDVRVPFLHPSTANELDEVAAIVNEPYSLLYCILDCAPIMDSILRDKFRCENRTRWTTTRCSRPSLAHRRLPKRSTVSYVAHLLVLVWQGTDRHRLRVRALEALGTSADSHERLASELLAGPLTATDLLTSLHCEFRDNRICDGYLYYASRLMGVLWPSRPMRTASALERAAFGSFLAACRRQRCAGTGASETAWNEMISGMQLLYIACATISLRLYVPSC